MGKVILPSRGGNGEQPSPAAWEKAAGPAENITYTIPGEGIYRINLLYYASGNYLYGATVNGVSVLSNTDQRLASASMTYGTGKAAMLSLVLRAKVSGDEYHLTDEITGYDFGISDSIKCSCSTGGGVPNFQLWRGLD